MAASGSTVAEHSPHYPKVEGSGPAYGERKWTVLKSWPM